MELPKTNDLPESDPRHHALNMSQMLKDPAQHAREEVEKVDDRRGKVLFELSAEVMLGLAKGMDHFAEAKEPAMR